MNFKPGDAVTWFRSNPQGGSKSCTLVPAVYIGVPNRKRRTTTSYIVIEFKDDRGVTQRRTVDPSNVERPRVQT